MTKVLCIKDQKQFEDISSAGRGSLVRSIFCESTAGLYVPLMNVFP